MSQTLHFNSNKETSWNKKKVSERKPVLDLAQVKYGKSIMVPENESRATLIYTEDTGEVFAGMGSLPVKKLSSVTTVASIEELPAPGVTDRLYIALATNTMHIWDGEKYHLMNGGEGGTQITVTPHVFEYGSKEDFPKEGSSPAIYIDKGANKVYRFEDGEYKELSGDLNEKAIKAEQGIKALEEAIETLKKDKADKDGYVSLEAAVNIAKKEIGKLTIPDVSGLATKEEISNMATKTELAEKASKLEMANKANITEVYTKMEMDEKLAQVQTIKGDDGVDGKSAYEIAVEGGFIGTEAEWLDSLKGKDADTDNFYSKSEVDEKLAQAATGGKVDLSGYAKSEEVEAKADKASVYTTEAADAKFATIDAVNKKLAEVSTIKGDKGDSGADGRDGRDGRDGKNAYELALENGFVGTEAEWLQSLKGQDGAPAEVDTSKFVQKEDLSNYAKASDIPDVSDYAKTSDIPDVTGLAKKTDIPDVSGFAKKEDIPAQKTLSELGGVTQAGVEAIIQGKNFLSAEAIKQMIEDAIAKALANNGGLNTDNGGGNNSGGSDTPKPEPTPEPQPEPTPTPTTPDENGYEWKWTKYFVVPAGQSNIAVDMNEFFGDTFSCDDMFGPDLDMKNTTVEIRALGNIADNHVNDPTYLINSPDDIKYAIDFTKKYKDGLRIPMDQMVDTAEFEKALDSFDSPNTGWMTYDGEAVLDMTCTTAAIDRLYMIRKLKSGTIPEYKVGDLIG